jgi:hypothetical protein
MNLAEEIADEAVCKVSVEPDEKNDGMDDGVTMEEGKETRPRRKTMR